MKPVLLIGDSPISMAPYIMSYIEVYEQNHIPFELVYWNKTMEDVSKLPNNYVPYNRAHDNLMSKWKKIFKINGFARFVKRRMKENDYSYIVVFTIAHAVFFHQILERRYKGRYVFDIRDHSPMCNVPFSKHIIKKLIDNAAFLVLSSRGFLRWLPNVAETRFVISHNTTSLAIKVVKPQPYINICFPITILTIGQLRDYQANSVIIDKFGNNDNYKIVFSGYGFAENSLKTFVGNNAISNVSFTGRYKKDEEGSLVDQCDMINIYYNHDINSDTLVSNRFYLSLLHRKPMIVRDKTYQAELVSRYGLGVVLSDSVDFNNEIRNYLNNFDVVTYNKNCDSYLNLIKNDMMQFEMKLKQLYASNSSLI